MNRIILLMLIIAMSSLLKGQGDLYWSDSFSGTISVTDLNSNNQTVTLLAESAVVYHALDTEGQKLYWVDEGLNAIVRSNPDGSDSEWILSGLVNPKGVSLDDNGSLYYVSQSSIFKADLDGNGVELFKGNLTNPIDIFFHEDKIYYYDLTTRQIEAIDIASGVSEVIVSEAFSVRDIEIDSNTGEIYWLSNTGGIPGSGIFKSELNGANQQLVIEEFGNGIAIDSENEILYWSESIFNTINKYDLLTEVNERLISQYLPSPRSITLDHVNDKIYWTDNIEDGRVFRANLSDGNQLQTLSKTSVDNPSKLEIDINNNKIYWVNQKGWQASASRTSIMRANLDGSSSEILVSNPTISNPNGLAIDTISDHIYWTDLSKSSISRANLDGTNVVEIISGLDNPSGITINNETERIYWTDWGLDKLQSCNFEGGDLIDVIATDLSTPAAIAISKLESKIYFTDVGSNTIHRSNFDGSESELILTTEGSSDKPNSIFIDEVNGKLYFSTDFFGKSIVVANLDGSDMQELDIENVRGPEDIFLINRAAAPDNDEDGYASNVDCDDNDANVNPGMEEVPYNGIDDDCNELTFDDDLDQDGYPLDMDCNDEDASVNPGIEEVVYNGIDDDCNELTFDDDLDQDGYLIDMDCDDSNPNIYPGAPEIPNNDIDEDCDGQDLLSNTDDLINSILVIYPNPSMNEINISGVEDFDVNIEIVDIVGQLKYAGRNDRLIYVDNWDAGTYFCRIQFRESGFDLVRKIVIID